jgi:ABC-2 type transport system permease protein
MASFRALYRSEVFRLTHRMMPKVMVLGMVVLVVGAYVLLWFSSSSLSEADLADQKEHLRIARAPDYGMEVVFQITMLISVVLASSSIATEYGWGTIRAMLAKTEGRWAFLSAKFLAVVTFIAVASVFGVGSALAGSAAVTAIGGLDRSLGDDFAIRVLGAAVRNMLVVLPYVTLAFLASLWFRATAAGVALVIVAFYTDVLLTPLTRAGEALSWFPEDALIYRNIQAVLDANALERATDLPDAWQAAAVLAVFSAVFLALAFWRFETRDVSAA